MKSNGVSGIKSSKETTFDLNQHPEDGRKGVVIGETDREGRWVVIGERQRGKEGS